MAILAGASWNFKNKAEALFRKEAFEYDSFKNLHSVLVSKNVINNKINNFGRSSKTSKLYSVLTALALHDCIPAVSSAINKNDTGLIAYSHKAATPDNEKFFTDYVEAGRKLARGNLFVYTLPTSPLGEAAIAFQLKGPVLFLSFSDNPLYNFIDQAEFIIDSAQTEGLISLYTDTNGTLCLLFLKDTINTANAKLISTKKVKSLIEDNTKTDCFIKYIKALI